MGQVEALVLEAVAKGAVQADMSIPDQCKQYEGLIVDNKRREQDEAGDDVAVADVINQPANMVVEQVAHHRNIDGEDSDYKVAPIAPKFVIDKQSDEEYQQTFQT